MDKMNFDEMKEMVTKEINSKYGSERKEHWDSLPFAVKMMAKEVTPAILKSFMDLAQNYSNLKYVFDKIGINEKTANLILDTAISHITDVFSNETFRQYAAKVNLDICEKDYNENKEDYEGLLRHFSNKFNEFMLMEALRNTIKDEKQGTEIHIVHGGKIN